MDKLLSEAKNKYFLKLGNQTLSPVLEASTFLALDYCEKVATNKLEVFSPYFFCFPDKQAASLWLSITLLTNYFLEDYVNSNNKIEFDLKHGTLVDIYGSIARFIREDSESGKLIFSFSDLPAGISFPKTICNVIKKTERKSVNKHDHFRKARRRSKMERNVMSQILLPNESEIINDQVLQSKILIVSGRGKMKVFRDLLEKIKINGEKLSHIFPENKNLIITPDLESFKDISNSKYVDDSQTFIRFFKKLSVENKDEELNDSLSLLSRLLAESDSITPEFHNEFQSFCNDIDEEEYHKLKFVKAKYPGFQELIPANLKAVIVNDINLFFDYTNTINAFLKINIPIIFVSDRRVEEAREFDTYDKIFSSNPEYFRINWNKSKIKSLQEISEPLTEYLDHELWSQCIKYSNQRILIKISEGNKLDNLLPVLQKQIAELEEFEVLKKSFFRLLYPALYALKNSISLTDSVKELIGEFKAKYDELGNSGLDSRLKEIIESTIAATLSYDVNSKEIVASTEMFSSVLLEYKDKRIFIPVEAKDLFLPRNDTQRIIFSGFPYKEYSGQYLLNSVFNLFIPNIIILCWPNEGLLTYNFLRRRIIAGYFTDKLIESEFVDSNYLINHTEEIEREVDTCLIMEGTLGKDILDQEHILEEIHSLRYAGFSRGENHKSNDNVKCDILNFVDESFMFLPKGAKILSEREASDGRTKIMNLKFNELTVGLRIFKYKKDRAAYREISKQNNYINECFNKLEMWRKALNESYNNAENDLVTLENNLIEIQNRYKINGSNPDRNNLKRWLYDEEIIAPDTPNLRLILLSQEVGDIDLKMEELTEAYRTVLSYTIGLSSKIKKNISKQLLSKKIDNDRFEIEIDGTPVLVETRTIFGLERNEISIDYGNTRKFLC